MAEAKERDYNYAYRVKCSAFLPEGSKKFEYLFAKIGDAVMFQTGMEEKGFLTNLSVVPLGDEE
tara:strand:+ start:1935 stop:2126 length:192 start_codon:yes stop_codon:yes gene_type:complete